MGISALGSAPPQASVKEAADEGFSLFHTILDTINPLQHLPIVSNIYRNLTGDTQNGFSHIVGNTLFGGPVSGAFAIASEVYKAATSEDQGATQTALTSGREALNSAKSAAEYQKMNATTGQWLNPAPSVVEAANNLTSASKIRATTLEWLTA